MSFSGVDIEDPIDIENGQVTASCAHHAAPTVTTASTNDMVVTAHTIAECGDVDAARRHDRSRRRRECGAGERRTVHRDERISAWPRSARPAPRRSRQRERRVRARRTITLRAAYQSYFAFGFSDGTTDGSGSSASQNGVATAAVARRMADKVLTVVKWDQTLLAEANLQSWNATGFTLNWTTNDSRAVSSIHYL